MSYLLPKQKYWYVNVYSMNTELTHDKLEIYDSGANLIGATSGTTTATWNVRMSNSFQLTFRSDCTFILTGFSASFQLCMPFCINISDLPN